MMYNLWYYVGLVIFVLVIVVDVAFLILDLVLLLTGQQTITRRAMGEPLVWAIVILWQVFGALGIWLHAANNEYLKAAIFGER